MLNKSNMFNNNLYLALLMVTIFSGSLLITMVPTNEASMIDDSEIRRREPALVLLDNPAETIRLLENLIKSIVLSSVTPQELGLMVRKRGLDLGINRGFSGSRAGKHLMGLSAASFAGGPGK